jgi:hypothetical protein
MQMGLEVGGIAPLRGKNEQMRNDDRKPFIFYAVFLFSLRKGSQKKRAKTRVL